MGTLLLILQENGLEKSRFHVSGNQSLEWKRGSMEVVTTGPWKIIFEALIGGVESDMAIDDINVSENSKCLDPGGKSF